MADTFAIQWDNSGSRRYETGTDRGVLYVADPAPATPSKTYNNGVAWNGLTAVTESPSGAEPQKFYGDNIEYGNILSAESFSATLEAFTYPAEFGVCDGMKSIAKGVYANLQARTKFGLTYRTMSGTDATSGQSDYIIHLLYGAFASPSEKAYKTINDSPEMMTFSWTINSIPVNVSGRKPTAVLTVKSWETAAEKLAALEKILYGTPTAGAVAAVPARLPLPDEVASIIGR